MGWSSFVAVVAVLTTLGTVQAAEVKLMASNAMKAPLEELLPRFETVSGHKIVADFHTAFALKRRIENGDDFDVAILGEPQIDDLLKQGKLEPATRVDLAVAVAGVVVRQGAPKPDVATVETFKRALIDAKSIALVETGAVGLYFKQLFARLGIAVQVGPKIKWLSSTDRSGAVPAHNPTALAVAAGEAEIGMTQISEILPTPGAVVAGPLPKEIQLLTVYPAAVRRGSPRQEAALALIGFLKSGTAAEIYKAKGLEPK